jgi:hypothetical protein
MTKVRFTDGVFQLDCSATDAIMGHAKQVFSPNKDIYRFIDTSRYNTPLAAATIQWDPTPTMFITRDCPPPFNIFHCSASMVNVVSTAIMYDVSLADLRILFMDDEPESFLPIWNALAGQGK